MKVIIWTLNSLTIKLWHTLCYDSLVLKRPSLGFWLVLNGQIAFVPIYFGIKWLKCHLSPFTLVPNVQNFICPHLFCYKMVNISFVPVCFGTKWSNCLLSDLLWYWSKWEQMPFGPIWYQMNTRHLSFQGSHSYGVETFRKWCMSLFLSPVGGRGLVG